MFPEIRHLHLTSRDHAITQRFYETYFGFYLAGIFSRGDRPSATILKSANGFQLFLEADRNEKLPSWFHFGFLTKTAEACIELHTRMQANNVTIVHPFITDPFPSYFFADPDGHTIQVYFDPSAKLN